MRETDDGRTYVGIILEELYTGVIPEPDETTWLERCWAPGCDEVWWSDGPEGIILHILRDHPGTGASVAIRRELLRGALLSLEEAL